MIVTLIAALFLLQSTIWIHAEGLSVIRLKIDRHPVDERLRLAIVVSSAILLHMLEIGLYAAITWLLNVVVDVGDIVGAREFSAMDYFYYSAETFAALGSGDLSATGGLRLIASLEPLNGLVLIAWTGAFTYWAMEHYWSGRQARGTLKKTLADETYIDTSS
jgi:hypothetical protein